MLCVSLTQRLGVDEEWRINDGGRSLEKEVEHFCRQLASHTSVNSCIRCSVSCQNSMQVRVQIVLNSNSWQH